MDYVSPSISFLWLSLISGRNLFYFPIGSDEVQLKTILESLITEWNKIYYPNVTNIAFFLEITYKYTYLKKNSWSNERKMVGWLGFMAYQPL